MAKITITFQEEGQQPTIVEIPAEIAAVLDAHAAALEASTGRPVGGKTGLFARMTWDNWLKPILSMRGVSLTDLAGEAGQAAIQARQQAQQAEALADMAAMQAAIHILPQD
jgi:hypothetical protein